MCSRGKEEGGSSWLAEAESACKAGGAWQEGTSRSHSCTEAEDLEYKREIKQHKFTRLVKNHNIHFLYNNDTLDIFKVNDVISNSRYLPPFYNEFNGTVPPSSG